ncbi:MAG: beta family protein [Patescibacteria group bacterium]|nr:beta family protein [Patescibacteria group bacterium]
MNLKLEILSLKKGGANNMFNSKHYIPILKWKRAEQGALKALKGESKKVITPLIQLVMPKSKPQEQLDDVIKRFEGQLPEIAKKIIEVWGYAPIFIDASLLYSTPLKSKSLDIISREGHKLGGIFIPVIHLNDDDQIKNSTLAATKETKSGLCIRLVCSDFTDTIRMADNIAVILAAGLNESDIDLLVDIKETGNNSDKYSTYSILSQNIPNLSKWRNFIFASGSFPEDLSECRLDEENLISRIDWKSWNENLSKSLKRKPAFSDYTIQHPIYKEAVQFFHPTSSIKYTLENDWLIMKGKKQKFELYLASAAELIKDKRFYGENFSDGDKYIDEKAKHFLTYIKKPAIKGTGSTETWLKAGINHHLELVAHQVSTLT